MHIPEGYLSPATAAILYAAAAPFWYRATRKVKPLLTGRFVPVLALFSAFSFVVMMFNIPLPGGTTGHAVGSVVAAAVLGPWGASLAVTVALVIQAFFFADGGILAIGANALSMAIAMPFVGYSLYRRLSGNAPLTSSRRAVAAAVAGYVAINVAALLTAIELGIQPYLFHTASGQALYFPYGLEVSIPAMALGHLTIAGLAEALVTGLVLVWLQRTNPQLLEVFSGKNQRPAFGRVSRSVWLGLIALIVLTPMGLLAPGTAWGEWGREELERLGLAYIPAGFDRWSDFWHAPVPDYGVSGLNNRTIAYMVSAALGVVLVLVVILALAWALARGAVSLRSREKGS